MPHEHVDAPEEHDVESVPDVALPKQHLARREDAQFGGREDVMAVLLKFGAEPNLPNKKEGNTSLHFAALNGRMGACKLLLAEGADKRLKNFASKTPLRVAEDAKKYEIRALMRDPPLVPDPPELAGPRP